MKKICTLKLYIIYILLLATIVGNKLQAENDGFSNNDSIGKTLAVTHEGAIGTKVESEKNISYQDMHLGILMHYMYVNKSNQRNATHWADTSELESLDELADNLDVNDLAATAASMRAQYVIFTAWHANMNVLYPSTVMKSHLPGHCSKRDVIRDLIKALKAKNIRILLYIHPSDGHDFNKEDQERVGWNDGAPYTRWNNFINEVIGELVDNYGKDVSGYWVDGGLPEQVDAARLRKTILQRNSESWIIQNSGLNPLCADYAAAEESMTTSFPATSWQRCQTITSNWWAQSNSVTYNPELAYRYTILQATVSNRLGGGACWSFGPYPGGRWELGIRSFCKQLGAFIDKAGISLFETHPSKAYITKDKQPLVGLKYVATESLDGKKTYLHLFLPPKGNRLELAAPADKRRFSSARLFSNNHKIDLQQTDSAVYLTLKLTDRWDDLDTIIILE